MSDNMKHAFANGRAWYQDISKLVDELQESADGIGRDHDNVRQEIEEGPLSVLVRDGWHMPGQACVDESPDEYEILLSCGGRSRGQKGSRVD